jgi:primosomal protein N'
MARQNKPPTNSSLLSISDIISTDPVLPGESRALYDACLRSVITELKATTALQIYLAEQIFDCLWWMRRYEQQKRDTILREMANILDISRSRSNISEHKRFYFHLLQVEEASKELQEILEQAKHSIDTLRQEAMYRVGQELNAIDVRITLKTKTLAGFQASYEALVNRNINRERLELQNAILTRDLQAIEMEKPSRGKSV